MEILQEDQDPSCSSSHVTNREVLLSIQPQSTNAINTTTSSQPTIQHVDPMTYTPSFQSNKAHQGFDVDKSATSDISASLLPLPCQAVDKKAFRERIEKWIEGIEHGEWEDRGTESLGDGNGDEMMAGGVACSKRRKRDRNGRYKLSDDENGVRGEKSRREERGNGDGVVKDLESKPSREEREYRDSNIMGILLRAS